MDGSGVGREMKGHMDKYRNLFENSVVAMFWSSLRDGMIIEANPAMRSLFGMDSFEGTTATDFYVRPDEARDRVKESLIEEGDVYNLELEFRKKDGSLFWGSYSARVYAEQGVIEGIIVDITSRKETEEALKKSEAKYKTLFDCANDAILIAKEGRIIDLNAQTLKMFGCSGNEVMMGESILKFSPAIQPDGKDTRAQFVEKTDKVLSGEPQSFELRHYRIDGTPFDAEVSLNRIELGGEILVQSIVRDITDRKRVEAENRTAHENLVRRTAELEDLNKELEAFSYSVSHDLRAPLRAIDGFSQALFEDYHDQLDEEGQDFLTRTRLASQRMARLIDDILKLSRISRTEVHYGRADLSSMASAIAAELGKTDRAHRVEFIIASGITVQGDQNLLRIVMENLLGNAYKFTGNGPGRIEFGAVTEQGMQVFFVRDNGAGFDMAYANKLFAPFQRLHRDDEFEGTGIGLATVQRIIHRHEGQVWAEGQVGKGATFYFTISRRKTLRGRNEGKDYSSR